MLIYTVRYRHKVKDVVLYHRWDLEPDQIVTVNQADFNDKGKYLDFDDGSGLYSKILSVTKISIRTEACVVRREDIVHTCRFHYPQTAYSGFHKREEHELIRGFRPQEIRTAHRMIKGYQVKYATPRIKVLVMKKISEKLKEKGATLDWAIDKLKGLAESKRGTIGDKHKVILSIMRAHGVELEGARALSNNKGNAPLLQQFNQFNIQQNRRQNQLPDKNEMKDIIEASHKVLEEPDACKNANMDTDEE
jgi:hypothetical protein